MTPTDAPTVGDQFTLNFSANYAENTPQADMVTQWLVNWNDGRGQQTYTAPTPGDSVTQDSDYSSTTTSATVNVTAVDGTGRHITTTKQLFFTPPAPTNTSTTIAAGANSATITWSGNDGLSTHYLVQRMDAGSTTWTTIGTVPASADTSSGSNSYTYTDSTITPSLAGSGSIYQVVNQDTDAPSDDPGSSGNSQSSPAPATDPFPGAPTMPSLDDDIAGLLYDNGAAVSGVTGSWSNGTGPFTNGQTTSFTITGLPTHMSFDLLVYGTVTDNSAGNTYHNYPDDSITMTGPLFPAQTCEVPSPDFVIDGMVADLNGLTTAQFNLNGTLDTGDSWSITSATVRAFLGSPSLPDSTVVIGGESEIPVHFSSAKFDENPAGYGNVLLTVSGVDTSLVQPLSSVVTLDAAGNGTLRIKGTKVGTSPITITDAVGDYCTASIGVTAPQVSRSVPIENQGATYGPNDTIPGFWFTCGPSLTDVPVNYNTDGSTLPSSLMGAIAGGTVTIPASPTGGSKFIPMEAADDGKIAPSRWAVVTLVVPGEDPGGSARIRVDNTDVPTVKINGETNNAAIQVDPEGVDGRLADIQMTIPDVDQTIETTTLSWSSELVIWLSDHVGAPGTDLGSKSGGYSYTWQGRGPKDVYAQAMNGSSDWDTTGLSLVVEVYKPGTFAVGTSTRDAGNNASGTANGPEIVYKGKYVNGIFAGTVVVGQGVSLSAMWLGPGGGDAESYL